MKVRITIIIILAFLISRKSAFSQEGFVRLCSESQLTIHGKSNINTFDCNYVFDEAEFNPVFPTIETAEKVEINNIKLSIPVNDCDCGNRLLNKDFRATLEAKEHPQIGITIDKLVFAKHKNNDTGKKALYALLQIAGEQRYKKINYRTNTIADQAFTMEGQIEINMESFDLVARTRLFGAIKVKDHVEITFFFKFVKNNRPAICDRIQK